MRFLVFLLAALVIAAPAQAQQYQQWTDPAASRSAAAAEKAANERLQGFVDELNRLTDPAEKSRAADPGFLRDLRGLAQAYDRPWRTRLLSDDFQDGDFTHNPGWTVTAGKYWVERGWGLRSAVKAEPAQTGGEDRQRSSGKDVAAAIFGQILQQALDPEGRATGGRQGTGAAATVLNPTAIQTTLRLTNAFAVEINFSSWVSEDAPGGRFEIGPYQGAPVGDARAAGYVLAYVQGGGLDLIRITGRGSSIIDSRPGPFLLEDKKFHRLEWTRRADGLMTVSLDGKEIMNATDRAYTQDFDGLRLVNRGGDYNIKSIVVNGTQ